MKQWLHVLKGLAKLQLEWGDGGQYPDVGHLRVGEESTNCSKSETGGTLDVWAAISLCSKIKDLDLEANDVEKNHQYEHLGSGMGWCGATLFVSVLEKVSGTGGFGWPNTYLSGCSLDQQGNEKDSFCGFFFEDSGGFMKLALKTFKTVWWQPAFKMFQQFSSSHATICYNQHAYPICIITGIILPDYFSLLGTKISPTVWHFWVDDFPFPKLGYVIVPLRVPFCTPFLGGGFQTFCVFTLFSGGKMSNLSIFFRWVGSTTNQL